MSVSRSLRERGRLLGGLGIELAAMAAALALQAVTDALNRYVERALFRRAARRP